MKRTPFAVYRQIKLAVSWYGQEYVFYRHKENEYGEPTESGVLVQTIDGIYHSSNRAFVELINSDGASVKSTVSKGLVCCKDNVLAINQGDYTFVQEVKYHVTAVEPILYSGEPVAYEISLEELVDENGHI